MIVRLMASPAARTPHKLKTITYGGAPMYVADCLRAIELFGPRLFQLFGQGEAPMTITGLPQIFHESKTASRQLRPAAHGLRSEDLRRERQASCRRRDRRDRHPLRLRDEGLLEEPGRDRQGAARRLAAHRRCRLHGRGGLPHDQGPLQGHDHLRRRQHLSARDRGGAAAPPRGRRVLGRRPPASRVG